MSRTTEVHSWPALRRWPLLVALFALGCSARRGDEIGEQSAVESHEDAMSCSRLLPGPPGNTPPAVALSRLHALTRFYGEEADATQADARLADALEVSATLSPSSEALEAYAASSPGLCTTPAVASALGKAVVRLEGTVAVVTPGFGDVVIPAEATAVAIDLETVPETPEGRQALDDALASSIVTATALARTERRLCNGMPDEVLYPESTVYRCATFVEPGAFVGGRSSTERPLALLSGTRSSPYAAYVAASLKASQSAALIGASIDTRIAESDWAAVGGHGFAVRTRRLLGPSGAPLPDVIEADAVTDDPAGWLRDHPRLVEATAPSGAATRPPIASLGRASRPSEKTRRGDVAAALITAHGALRSFFPFFDLVDDSIDARLMASLAALDGVPSMRRGAVADGLRRLTSPLHDGHVMVRDLYAMPASGGPPSAAPFAVLPVGEKFVVALSVAPNVRAGDEVLAIGDETMGARFERVAEYYSASPGTLRYRVAGNLVVDAPGHEVRLRSPRGEERVEHVQGVSAAPRTHGMYDRPAGRLSDLDAPDVMYVTLNDGASLPSDAELDSVFSQMAGAGTVILDMRGYPGRGSAPVLGHVLPSSAEGPRMTVFLTTSTTRDPFQLPAQTFSVFSDRPQGYTGKVILLVGPGTQSAAEHLTSFFVGAKRGKVIGHSTSGANGNVTGVELPGGYSLTFTGMRVDHQDGRPFETRGHIPDIEVEPTIDDLAAGRDAVLLRAIAEAHAP